MVHGEGEPLIGGERLQQLVDNPRQLALVGQLFGRRDIRGEPVDRVGLTVVSASEGMHECVVRLAPHAVNQQVASDAIDPAAETAGRKIIPRLVEDPQERLLRQILAELPVANVAKEKPDQGALVALDQLVEGGRVARLHPHHELVVIGHLRHETFNPSGSVRASSSTTRGATARATNRVDCLRAAILP